MEVDQIFEYAPDRVAEFGQKCQGGGVYNKNKERGKENLNKNRKTHERRIWI